MHVWANPTMLKMQKTPWIRAKNACLCIPDHVDNAKKRNGSALKMHCWPFPTMLTMQKTLWIRAENACLGIPDHVENAKNAMDPR